MRKKLSALEGERDPEILKELGVCRAYSQPTLDGIWLVLPRAPQPPPGRRLPRERVVLDVEAKPGAMTHRMGGRAVERHVCGEWMRSVGHHAREVHGMSPAEYRRRFGLNRGTPLCSLEYSQKCRLRNRRLKLDRHIERFRFEGSRRPPAPKWRLEGRTNIAEAVRVVRS